MTTLLVTTTGAWFSDSILHKTQQNLKCLYDCVLVCLQLANNRSNCRTLKHLNTDSVSMINSA